MSPESLDFSLSPTKRALLEALLAKADLASNPSDEMVQLDSSGVFSLSFAQERLWLLEQIEQLGNTYNVWDIFKLSGPVEPDLLESSLDQIARRHAVLRTTYELHDGEPAQIVHPDMHIKLERIDLTAVPLGDRQENLYLEIRREIEATFNLAAGPMMRAKLFQSGSREYYLTLVYHHIISDEWSRRILYKELSSFYQAGLTGQQPVLPGLSIQYPDFAAWQRQAFNDGKLNSDLDYWRVQLKGAHQVLDLPRDFPRPAMQTFNGARSWRYLPVTISRTMHSLCQQERVTMFTASLAVFAALLYRYSNQADILIGTPIANRTRLETQDMMGFFLNTLVIRSRADGHPTFRQFLRKINETVLDAFDHQNYPFEKLVDDLKPGRDLSRNPLFQVMFVFLHKSRDLLVLPEIRVEKVEMLGRTAKFDLTLFLNEKEDGLTARMEYNTDLFSKDRIDQMMDHFQALLESVLANPDLPLDDYDILTSNERDRIRSWRGAVEAYPQQALLHQFFEQQAERTPDAIAVEGPTGEQGAAAKMTYQEMNRRANQLARYLRQHGAGPDAVVGICAERSTELLIAVLAVLKAGGACLPFDPAYPRARLEYILTEARPAVLLIQSSLAGLMLEDGKERFYLDKDWAMVETESGENLDSLATPESLCYILYTSGSTGSPKGVAMPHRPLVNLTAWQVRQPGFDSSARTLQFSSLSFDVAFQEIFTTWATGGRMILIGEDTRRNPDALLAVLVERQVERLFLPFVALQALAEAAERSEAVPASLRQVTTAGEQLQITRQIADLFSRLPRCRLHNQYGPTETHVVTAYTLLGTPDEWPQLPPIGRPVANVQVHVLGPDLKPVPVGVSGEIYLAGACLAQGYYQQPDLTRERFVELPDEVDGQAPGQRRVLAYRTGDQGRWLAGGQLEFLGRSDSQVKIRGYRVEPGEIETVLRQHAAVRQAAVASRNDANGNRRLAAYLVVSPGTALNAETVRLYLSQYLPEYMIPADIVFLQELPLTPSGKVDRLRLPEPTYTASPESSAWPQDGLEAQLVAVWEDVLGVRPIDAQASFFELGGHSLLAIRLFAELHDRLGIILPVSSLFQSPTVRELARLVRSGGQGEQWSSLVLIHPGTGRRPFFCAHGFGGGVLGYADLARLLGGDQPFYGLQAAGFNGGDTLDRTIPEMAARYIKLMQTVQPVGPYRVGGYCFGGVVAYEIACQLEEIGEATELVAIMEGYAPWAAGNAAGSRMQRLGTVWKNLPYWLEDYRGLGFKGVRAGLAQTGRLAGRWLQRRMGLRVEYKPQDVLVDDLTGVPPHHLDLMRLHLRALQAYRPHQYGGKVVVFSAQGLTINQALFGLMDETHGWGQLALGGAEVRKVAGGHRNIHLEPNVASLAAVLGEVLSLNSSTGRGSV